MGAVVLKDFPLSGDLSRGKEYLRIKDYSKMSARFEELVEQARGIARPKAAYTEAFVDSIEGYDVTISGVKFKSRVMSSNLEKIGRVFAFAATCGVELEEWSRNFESSMLDQYLADGIKQFSLYAALEYVSNYLGSTYELGKTSAMTPGSLPDWPRSEQKPLFSVIGDVETLIGVKLTETFLLVPVKSASGILFPNDAGYVNCKLCTKKNCVGRRAAFDAQLYKEKLG